MSFLIVERIVLESLQNREKDLRDLENDTGLERKVLLNVLQSMMFNGWVVLENLKYKIEKLPTLGKDALKSEVKELVAAMVNSYFGDKPDGHLTLKKATLTPEENEILNAYLYQINLLLEEAQSRKQGKTKHHRVIFWGNSSYDKLIEETLAAV